MAELLIFKNAKIMNLLHSLLIYFPTHPDTIMVWKKISYNFRNHSIDLSNISYFHPLKIAHCSRGRFRFKLGIKINIENIKI